MNNREFRIHDHARECHIVLSIVGLLLLLSSNAGAQPLRREVVGYFPSWKWNAPEKIVRPRDLAFDKLTIVNYAFFAPRPDGTISGINPIGDSLYLRCGGDTDLVSLAHSHGVKVMLSVGGWEDSDNFPAVAAADSLRVMFAHSCMWAIREFGFDGIDVDWEFPGLPEHRGTPSDTRYCTLLLRTVRDSLNAYSKSIGRALLLTAALPAGQRLAQNFEMKEVADILDFLNIMTYDFTGAWDARSYYNSPLYAPSWIDSSRCVAGAFSLYHLAYGIPAAKINLGVPFYGHTFASCTAPNTPHKGADTLHFPPSGAEYSRIVALLPNFTRHWDDQARVPYLTSDAWNMMVSYDDEQSVRAKAQFVIDNDARGLIIWELTHDVMPDGSEPLLEAIAATFRLGH